MIFTSIYSNDDQKAYPEVIRKMIEYLKANDFVNMEPGVYELQGRDLYVQVFDAETGSVEEKKPESHKEYLDIQFLASGEEKLGFTPYSEKYEVEEYIKERDLIFYKGVENEGFIHAVPGCISVFFPCDIHRPAVVANAPMTVRKVVIKVRTTLI